MGGGIFVPLYALGFGSATPPAFVPGQWVTFDAPPRRLVFDRPAPTLYLDAPPRRLVFDADPDRGRRR